MYLLVYVDDILVAAKNAADIQHVKDRLRKVSKVRDLGEAKYFLGMSLDRDRQAKTLTIKQERLATELMSRHRVKESKTKSVPMSTSIKLELTTEDNLLGREAFPYSELAGSLLYLSVCTGPDISQAMGVLARKHGKAQHGALDSSQRRVALRSRYLEAWHVLWRQQHTVEGYCNGDYASDLQTRRSTVVTTGFVYI